MRLLEPALSENQLFAQVQAGSPQQACDHGFLEARRVELDANDAVASLKVIRRTP